MTRLHCVLADNVKHVWNDISLWIENAAIKGPFPVSPDDLRKACENGERQLWIVKDGANFMAAAITDIFGETHGIVLEFVAVGGRELDQWVHFEREIADRAKREIGAKVSRMICRPGIMRKMEPRGYRVKGYIMERQL